MDYGMDSKAPGQAFLCCAPVLAGTLLEHFHLDKEQLAVGDLLTMCRAATQPLLCS